MIGVSAGAHHAAALTLLANRSGGPRFLQQVLVCPATDAAMDTPSYEEFAEGYFLGRAAMRDYWERYAPDAETRAQRAVSPLRASSEQLRGCRRRWSSPRRPTCCATRVRRTRRG